MRLLRILAPVTCVLALLVTRPAPFAALTAGLRAAALAEAGAERTLHRTMGQENIICRLYLDPHDKFTRVVAPQRSSLAQTGAVEAEAVLSTITVNYTGFTAQAQAAFQAAVDIWKTQVGSPVPIVVDADFQAFSSTLLLGQAGSTCSFRDFTGVPRSGTWFPVPIANRAAGTDLLPTGTPGCSNPADITASFNSTANWYYGTDGLTPSGQVDFVSVVLHELGHGLGFAGSAQYSASSGTGGFGFGSGFPFIYDSFAVDALTGGNTLLNASVYPNGGTALGSALRGNSIFWDGTNGKAANGGARPKLYAPATFSSGSSFSHLDETTFTPGNINSLMTPTIGSAEAIHTPGPIMMGMFNDMGWGSTNCSFGLNRTAVNVGAAGGNVSVTLSTSTGCAWTASTTASFVTIPSASASGNTSALVSMTVAANSSASSRVATVSIGGLTLTITQAGSGPAMSLDRTSLIFSAVNSGVAFTAKTGTQSVRLTQTGTGTVTWTAASTTPWLLVSPTSGTGSATLNISTQFVSGLAATQTGSITLTFTGAGNTAGPVTVTLTSLNGAQAAAPTGSFDTPTDNSTGVTGSIAVTGWAMDDVEVTGVRILRDPVAGETPGVLVPIGDAVLVDGARPDVQAAFPSSPRNTRAGWGYLMLTNFLPALGNGTFRLTAIADDADGRSTTLGTKTITCTNGTATAPFGAIDTPAQGGTVSGTVINFGWVLSPGTRRADPPGGGTVRVVLDGAIAPGIPGDWTSRGDLSALFPVAQFSGIGTALGVASFNSTTMTNGTHTISWLVTDNNGSASGIGSRYIQVSNGSLFLEPGQSGATTAGSNVITSAATMAMPRAAALRIGSVSSLLDEVNAAPGDFRSIAGRRGYNLDTPLQPYGFRHGSATMQSEELDRIELRLSETAGHSYSGYLRAAGSLAPLPIGSALNGATGAFTWQPGVGFVGSYDLVFVRWSGGRAVAKQDVRIVLNPKGSNHVGPQVVIDLPAEAGSHDASLVAQPFVVAGWAADLDSTIDAGVDAVHVWAYPLTGGEPIFIGAAAYGGARPDVAAVYGERFARSGYGIQLKGLEHGNYDIAVFAYSTVTGGFVPAKTVRLTVR